MHVAIDTNCLPTDRPLMSKFPAISAAGCVGITLHLDAGGVYSPASPVDEYSDLARSARDAGLRVSTLITPWPVWDVASADFRKRADSDAGACRPLLERAAAVDADVLVLEPVSAPGQLTTECVSPECWTRMYEALSVWQWEAENHGIMLAVAVDVDPGWSLRAAADLIDAVNSAWVGLSLRCDDDSAGAGSVWIPSLGGRICHVVANMSAEVGDADWPAVVDALCSVGFGGVITLSGAADDWPAVARALVEHIATAAPPPTQDVH